MVLGFMVEVAEAGGKTTDHYSYFFPGCQIDGLTFEYQFQPDLAGLIVSEIPAESFINKYPEGNTMIDPIEPNLLSALSSPSTPTPGQTSFSDMVQGMKKTAGKGTTEANLLDDWKEQITGGQGAAAQRDHPKPDRDRDTTPNIQNAAGADNTNTGSINGSTLV